MSIQYKPDATFVSIVLRIAGQIYYAIKQLTRQHFPQAYLWMKNREKYDNIIKLLSYFNTKDTQIHTQQTPNTPQNTPQKQPRFGGCFWGGFWDSLGSFWGAQKEAHGSSKKTSKTGAENGPNF